MIDKEKWDKAFNELPDEAPVTEPERQYYFINKCRQIVKKINEERGLPLSYKTVTFGCQMNARDSEKLVGILEQIGYVEAADEEKADFVLILSSTIHVRSARMQTRESTDVWDSLEELRRTILT